MDALGFYGTNMVPNISSQEDHSFITEKSRQDNSLSKRLSFMILFFSSKDVDKAESTSVIHIKMTISFTSISFGAPM